MLLATYIAITLGLTDLRERTAQRVHRDDRGSVTLEQAVIGSALFLAAVSVGAIIVRAIMSRANQIQ